MHIAPKTALLCGQTVLEVILFSLFCIFVSFCVLFLSFFVTFRVCVTQNLHLGRPPRLSLRLLPLTGTLRRCFVLYTFSKGADNLPIRTDKMCPNHSYCAACHCSTTRDVALDAFNSNFFLWAPIFRVCVTQNCILDGLRGYLFAFCR